MKRSVLAVLVAVVIAATQGSAGNGQEPPGGMSSTAWGHVLTRQLKDRRSGKSGGDELFARLVAVMNGVPLDAELKARTLAMANSPQDGFGVFDTDGWTWMTAVFVLTAEKQQAQIKSLEARVAAVEEALRRSNHKAQ